MIDLILVKNIMKLEHYQHVTNHYNYISSFPSEASFESIIMQVDVNLLRVSESATDFRIMYKVPEIYPSVMATICLFSGIPSREIAVDILEYIKNTEMLFI